MNILGHSYVATHSVHGDNSLLIIGSLLPESFLFISNNPFSQEEIHEGGKKFLWFLRDTYPDKCDLALGMLSHGYNKGADKFNKEIEMYAGSQREKLLNEIAECSSIDLNTAEYRLHNFLWWGVDVWILRKFPRFVEKIQRTLGGVDIGGISRLLSEAFGKKQQATERVMKILFREIYQPRDLTSIEGLTRIWARQAKGLPEKDRVDITKAVGVIRICVNLLKNEWKNYLEKVRVDVSKNLKVFL